MGLDRRIFDKRATSFLWFSFSVILGYVCAFLLRFEFHLEPEYRDILVRTIWLAPAVYIPIGLLMGVQRRGGRFVSLGDGVYLLGVYGICAVAFGVVLFILQGFTFFGFPRSILINHFLLVTCLDLGGRGLSRFSRDWKAGQMEADSTRPEKRILVLGDLHEAELFLRSFSRNRSHIGKIVGLMGEGGSYTGRKIHGVDVLGDSSDLGSVVENLRVSTLAILPPYDSPARIKATLAELSEKSLSCELRMIPDFDAMASGKLTFDKLRPVEIDDLLEREPYDIDLSRLEGFIKGKKVMVTGAGGSIGSEICRQVLNLRPSVLVMFDVSEFLLFTISRELTARAEEFGVKLDFCVGDIRKEDQVRNAIRKNEGIDVLYHAAAYKHVGMMEKNVPVCFMNNVLGTETVAGVAEEEGIEQFVLISTDKAVRPTSVMGASKRLAEKCIIERPQKQKTRFKAVRFGNVLGSSGSVVPIFKEQIAAGGPVTVTSPKVTRYFMTIPEAVELVLTAGAVVDDRHICVLQMGEPVKIDTLARRMIELSGLIPDVDIPITYIGLYPGEKEYEELLTDDEDVVPTDYDRISVMKKNVDGNPIDLDRIRRLIDEGDSDGLRQYAHECISGSLLYGDDDSVENTETELVSRI